MTAQILTQSRLKELLKYYPDYQRFVYRTDGRVAPASDSEIINIDGIDYSTDELAVLYVTGYIQQPDEYKHPRNTSGCTGVSWNKRSKKWQVYLTIKGRTIHGGTFTNQQEAIDKRHAMEIEHNYQPYWAKK